MGDFVFVVFGNVFWVVSSWNRFVVLVVVVVVGGEKMVFFVIIFVIGGLGVEDIG